MKVTRKETRLEISEAVEKKVKAKIDKLSTRLKRLGSAVELRVEMERTTRHHRKGLIYRVELNLKVLKKLLRAEVFGEDIITALDDAIRMLEREIERFKMSFEEKNYRRGRLEKKLTRMTPLAWRGAGREKEQADETVPEEV